MRRRGVRSALLAAATLAVAGSAVAATSGWHPLIGDEATDGPPTLSSSAVPAAFAKTLAVLRRQPTARDHGPAVEATLHGVSGYHVGGVRPESIRYLAPGVGHQAAILFSVREADAPWARGDLLCVSQPVVPDGSAQTCFGLAQIRHGEALGIYDGPHGSVAYGLVPDGVATVTAHFADGSRARIPVVNNYFHVSGGSLEQLGPRTEAPAVDYVTIPNRPT